MLASTDPAVRVYREVLQLLAKDPDGRMEELLSDIAKWDQANPPMAPTHGFEWHMVSADVRTLNSLVPRKILRVTFKSNSGTEYRPVDRSAMERALADHRAMTEPLLDESHEIPADLFDLVVGHEDKKEILLRVLRSEKPLHVLLHGTVASAKTLILECLMRLPRREFILGSSFTKAGLYDLLFSTKPAYLLIDELDKMGDQANLAALLSLMHKGYIAETKYGRRRNITLETRVFASANDVSRLPVEIKSRFVLLRFQTYTDDEFLEVASTIVADHEGVEEGLAVYIARKVRDELRSRDVRDAVKVARLLGARKTAGDVDKVVRILLGERER